MIETQRYTKINLIVPSALDEEELGQFHLTLREVLSFIKYSDSVEKLVANVKSLMRTMGWTAEHAMDALDVLESDRQTVSSQL